MSTWSTYILIGKLFLWQSDKDSLLILGILKSDLSRLNVTKHATLHGETNVVFMLWSSFANKALSLLQDLPNLLTAKNPLDW